MSFTSDQMERYSRQIILKGIGVKVRKEDGTYTVLVEKQAGIS